MTTDIQKLDPDAAIDLAYDIFLEMAGENLDPADIMLFNLQFEDVVQSSLSKLPMIGNKKLGC